MDNIIVDTLLSRGTRDTPIEIEQVLLGWNCAVWTICSRIYLFKWTIFRR